jgi:multiple sugar transport system substrate-binding protein
MSREKSFLSHKVSRRAMLKNMGAGAAGLMLAACGQATEVAPQQQQQPAMEDPVELVFHGRTGAQGDFFTAQAELFKEAMEGKITVKVELTPPADYDTKLATLVAGGQLGDGYHTFPFGSMYPFAAKGVAKALDNYISADAAWDPGKFFPVAVELTKWNGKTYAVPIGLHSGWSAWTINLDMWQQAGCELPKWEWSYQNEWVTNVRKMQDFLDKQPEPKRFAYQFDYNGQNTLLFILSFGGNWIEPVDRKVAMINDEKTKEALAYMRELVNTEKFTPRKSELVENAFPSQLIASYTTGIYAYGTVKNTVKDFQWQMFPAPSGPNGGRGTFVGVDYFCMNNKTENSAQVMEWFKWFVLNKDTSKAMLEAGFSPSAVVDNWNNPPLSDNPSYQQAKQWLSVADAWPMPANARVAEFNQAFNSGFEAVINGENDFNTEIENLQKKVQAVLDQPPL